MSYGCDILSHLYGVSFPKMKSIRANAEDEP